MKVIGLTGQSGSGKSFLGQIFTENGIPSINADEVSHKVTGSDPGCLSALRRAFGDGIFEADGTLSRKKLGAVVFSAPEKLTLLNRTVFPFINREIERRIAEEEARGTELVLLDAPTLYEAGADRYCDFVAAVCAPFEARLERIIERDKISREAALLRLRAQHDDAFYREKADAVLVNDADKEAFAKKINELIYTLRERFTKA